MSVSIRAAGTSDREVDQLEEELLEWVMEKSIQGRSPHAIDAAIRSVAEVTAVTEDGSGFLGRLNARSREIQGRRIQLLAC